MDRREVLAGMGAGVTLLGGCSGSGNDELRDSDDDGMIDSKDYAPNDAAVQQKSDLQKTTTAVTTRTLATQTPTQTPRSTATQTPRSTTTQTPRSTAIQTPTKRVNTLRVTGEYWQDSSRIDSFSAKRVDVVVQQNPKSISYSNAKVVVVAYDYPTTESYDYTVSDSFSTESKTNLSFEFDPSQFPTEERINYLASIFPGDKTLEEASSSDFDTLMETDPFVVHDDYRIERKPHPDALTDDSGEGFTRNVVEGAYIIQSEGQTKGQQWSAGLTNYKSAYLRASNRQRGRAREEYVSYALSKGIASALANILKDEAKANGFTGARQQAEFVIDFVQRLPYVPDDVSKGYDDYTKFCTETLAELGGDCEDTSVLLAAILQAEPFGYDMILIQPPGHMAVGVYNTDPRGYYWELNGRKYSYIETTGEGWGVGDCPEKYRNSRAALYQV